MTCAKIRCGSQYVILKEQTIWKTSLGSLLSSHLLLKVQRKERKKWHRRYRNCRSTSWGGIWENPSFGDFNVTRILRETPYLRGINKHSSKERSDWNVWKQSSHLFEELLRLIMLLFSCGRDHEKHNGIFTLFCSLSFSRWPNGIRNMLKRISWYHFWNWFSS